MDHDLSHIIEENIMNQGAMDILISNDVKATTSQKVKDILCRYCIKPYSSEPHHQHHNSPECCIGHIKDVTNWVLPFTGAPNNLWLLCLMYVVYILNITANSSVGDISPHQHLYGQTPDISPTVCFRFDEPVYYSDINSFPAAVEKKGRCVSFAPNVGDTLTFHIGVLTNDTPCSIYHSAVHSALITNKKNLHLESSEGEDDPHKPVKQVLCTQDTESEEHETPLFQPLNPDDLIGCTFLTTLTEDGQCFHAHIINALKKSMKLLAKSAPNSSYTNLMMK